MADLYSRKLMAPRGTTRLSYCGTGRPTSGDFLSVSRLKKAKIHAPGATPLDGSFKTSFSDYLALTKPKITPLLLMAALGSAVVAARGVPPVRDLAGVLVGGALASSGALALNSYLEMGMDSKMKRTMGRPLPSGRIVSPSRALFLGLGLVVAGLVVAGVTLDYLATFFIGLGAFVYIPVYTLFLKPRTTWNIVLGGFAGSCAALAGWYSIPSAWSSWPVGWLLGALVFVWTPSHFWSLAVITEEDYSAVNVPMLPSVVGPEAASKYIVMNTLLLIPVSLLYVFYFLGIGFVIYVSVAVVFDLLLLGTNIKLFRAPTKENAWLAFKFSSPYLAVIFLVAMVAAVLG